MTQLDCMHFFHSELVSGNPFPLCPVEGNFDLFYPLAKNLVNAVISLR